MAKNVNIKATKKSTGSGNIRLRNNPDDMRSKMKEMLL